MSSLRSVIGSVCTIIAVLFTAPSIPTMPVFDDVDRDRDVEPLYRRPQSAWWSEVNDPDICSDKMFRAELRLSREVFSYVVKQIENDKAFAVPVNIGGRAISVARQLAVFLLRVGSNTPSSIVAQRLGISSSSVPECMRRAATAIDRCLGHHLSMPLNGTQEKANVKAQFASRQFRDAVGIIDCTHVRIVVPSEDALAGHAAAYVDRLSQHSLTYQALVTIENSPRFLDISGGIIGSAYDTKVLERSFVYKNIAQFLEDEEYFMGDMGYPLRPWMMTGYKTAELAKMNIAAKARMERFNRLFSGVRISVERAFGILKARFKGLRERFHVRGKDALKTYQLIFMAACILHNVCADKKAPLPSEAEIKAALAVEAVGIYKKRKALEEDATIFKRVGGSLEEGRAKRQKLFDEIYT